MVMRRGIEALPFSIGKLLKFIQFTRALRIVSLVFFAQEKAIRVPGDEAVFSWQPEKKNVWRL